MKRKRPAHYQGVLARWPLRYFSALKTPELRFKREKELLARRRTEHPTLAETNKYKTRTKSTWTKTFHRLYPNVRFNKDILSKKFGISRRTLDIVYNRGLKAWKTGGSRVGANPYQWATARVYKYILLTKKKVPAPPRFDPNNNLRRK